MKRISNSIRDSVVGYCRNRVHKGKLTPVSIKEHNCIYKNCPYLQKYDCQYWEQLTCERIRKKVKRFYIKNKEEFSKTISLYDFLKRTKLYYGSWNKIPINSNEAIDISEFIEFLSKSEV